MGAAAASGIVGIAVGSGADVGSGGAVGAGSEVAVDVGSALLVPIDSPPGCGVRL